MLRLAPPAVADSSSGIFTASHPVPSLHLPLAYARTLATLSYTSLSRFMHRQLADRWARVRYIG